MIPILCFILDRDWNILNGFGAKLKIINISLVSPVHEKIWCGIPPLVPVSCRPLCQKFFLISLETYIVHAFPISICQDITRDLHVHVHLDHIYENHEGKRGGRGHKTKRMAKSHANHVNL